MNNKLQDITIVKYEDKYKDEIIGFLIDVAIGEFGYTEWENYFKTKSFEPYKNNEGEFLIALNSKGKIIGTCGALKKTDTTIKLNTFYILSEYRDKGIGRKLYNMIMDYILEKNYKEIILCTFEKFNIAIKFYEKRGYKLYETIDDEFWYKKEL